MGSQRQPLRIAFGHCMPRLLGCDTPRLPMENLERDRVRDECENVFSRTSESHAGVLQDKEAELSPPGLLPNASGRVC